MDKKTALLETALKLFTENGFHGTPTSKIALDSNVATGTLFNYFKTKEELIVSLYFSVLKDMDDFIIANMYSQSISKESFRSIFETTLSWSLQNPLKFKYLLQFTHSPYLKVLKPKDRSFEGQPLFILIQNGIDLVLIKQLPVSFIYSLFTAQINGLFFYIVSNDLGKDKQSEFLEEAFEMFWKMIED